MFQHAAQRFELKDTKDRPQRLQSLDQLLAENIGQATRFPSLRLGSGGISWSRAGITLPTDGDPARIFAKLFVDDNANAKQQTRQFLREDASILDVVRQDAKRLNTRLAKADQDKLDQFSDFNTRRRIEVEATSRLDRYRQTESQ